MFNKKSEYAQNKREKDSIIYISVNGRIQLTRADFASEEEFLRWETNGPMRTIMRRNVGGEATMTMGFLWTKT